MYPVVGYFHLADAGYAARLGILPLPIAVFYTTLKSFKELGSQRTQKNYSIIDTHH
jgi:hypothetical protein